MSSDSSTTPRRAPGLLWILAALLCFAALSFVLQGVFGQARTADPRGEDRAKNLEDVKTAQAANVKKMGLEAGSSTDRFAKTLEVLKTQAAATSKMVVPGSPTQLKQSAAPAAAPAPAPAPAK